MLRQATEDAHRAAAEAVRSAQEEAEARSRDLRVRMGNLGWDSEPADLVSCVTKLLNDAAVPQDAYNAMEAATGELGVGTAVEMYFTDETAFNKAMAAIRAQQRRLDSSQRVAWLDRKKSREELRPARQLHRLCGCLVDIGVSMHGLDKSKFEKLMVTERALPGPDLCIRLPQSGRVHGLRQESVYGRGVRGSDGRCGPCALRPSTQGGRPARQRASRYHSTQPRRPPNQKRASSLRYSSQSSTVVRHSRHKSISPRECGVIGRAWGLGPCRG